MTSGLADSALIKNTAPDLTDHLMAEGDENLELRVHMYHLQQEVDRLEARLSVLSKEEARGRHEATSESRKQCEALVKELEAREQQNKILENNEKANELKLLNLQAQIDGLSKEKETLQEHLNTSASLVSELDSSVVEWSQCAGELREEVCLLRESNDKQEVLVRDCERDKQNYAEQLDDCSSQVLRLAAELQSIMRERDELKKQLRTLEKHARTAARLEAESHCLQSELTLATKTAEDQERTIHLLTAEKAADAGKWVNTTSEIARLESEVKSLHQTVKEQDNELEKASFAFIKAVQLEREVCTVGRELDAAKTTLAEQESELARSEEEIKSFKSQIAAQNRELEAYESLGFEYQQLIMHADSQALQEMCRQLQTWARQNATLHMEVHTLRNNYNMLALDLRLKQKALQDLANVSLATERSHSGQVQELTHANLQQQVLVKQLGSQTEQLQKEMNALQTARVAVIEKNALLENCNTSLLSELHRLKRRVQEHEHQIQVSEAHAADVAEQLRECRTLLDEVWEDVQTCSSVASDRQTGMEALRCATVRLEKTAAQSMSLQKGPLTTNTTTVGCFSPEDKRADQQRQPVAALKEQLLGANRELRAMQCKMFHLSKERDQRDEEVKNVEALLQV